MECENVFHGNVRNHQQICFLFFLSLLSLMLFMWIEIIIYKCAYHCTHFAFISILRTQKIHSIGCIFAYWKKKEYSNIYTSGRVRMWQWWYQINCHGQSSKTWCQPEQKRKLPTENILKRKGIDCKNKVSRKFKKEITE